MRALLLPILLSGQVQIGRATDSKQLTMNARDYPFLHLLEGPKQFLVPVFQRDYSWKVKHRVQLWQDILRVGKDANSKGHFLGSVVYIAAEDMNASLPRWLLIDGQQRLTTICLLLAALRNQIKKAAADGLNLPKPEALDDYYLRNPHESGALKSKLCLRRADQETLEAIFEAKDLPESTSEHFRATFEYFTEQLENEDLAVVYSGIKKLIIVDVCLTRGQDDPQMIFESLNSTGLDLTQADLIRNFVLMRQDEKSQTALYQDYWQPLEVAFGARYSADFDKFVRDYLTLQLMPSKQLKADDIYQQFRTYFYGVKGDNPVRDILATLKRFGQYYVAFSLGHEQNMKLRDAFRRLRLLVEVASPVVLKLYDCFDRAKTLSLDEFVVAVELLESYVFRRSVCAMQTRSLGQIFASLAYRIKDDAPLLSLKVALCRQTKKRRFPTDAEFRESLETHDVFDMRHCKYLLDRLENDSKEVIDTTNFSIEHIMPQNENLRAEWQTMLGKNWKQIQETWLHRLGNITLTGYNSEYSDLPFEKKKTLEDRNGNQVGFNFSPLRLNKYVREQSTWTESEMEKRGKEWAARGVNIWPVLFVEMAAVKATELEERRTQASKYSLDNLEFDTESKVLFDVLRPQIRTLGEDVIELFGAKSVTYRVYDFFVEVLPRRRKLLLIVNLDFADCDDPSGIASDATEWSFISNASEEGGTLFTLDTPAHVGEAMHIIRQGYQSVAE